MFPMLVQRIPAVLLLVFTLAQPAMAQEIAYTPMPFAAWLDEFKQEAREQGISQETLDEAFADTQPIDSIIELDRKQPESTLTLQQYLQKVISQDRIREGRALYQEHRELLTKIGKEYGVQPRFIVALWGIETNYGSNTGSYSVIDALATLAYDGRRSEYFRGELINALKIIDADHISAASMDGSWAGAMGQCQFMPSSFLQYAVDYDGDGSRNIWTTEADVFASIANYLHSSGWNSEQSWGGRASLPSNFDTALADIKQSRPVDEWRQLGVKRAGGKLLPQSKAPVYVILVGEGENAAPYIITENYKVILKWNRSRYFATAVGTLADLIEAPASDDENPPQ
jgi:membrane-bound lytic murein transglycosylase B